MPPKPSKGPTNKTEQKKKQKLVEDKTFGMKKTKKNLQYINQLQKSVAGNQKAPPKKKGEEDDLKDITKIFKPVQDQPKVAQDVDPKSVLCVFFKQGLCQKGNKCKFSHDLSVQQKTAKKNLYVDSRDIKKDDEKEETNENWDEKQLAEVIEKKHGEKDRKRPNQTDIVCKYFLDAVEDNKYGWFWECPNGGTCIYRHALPPGFVLKKDKKRLEELKRLEEISLEELIEKERNALSSKTCTKVTLESFIAWKKRKLREKRQKAAAEEKEKRTNFRSGKQLGLSGRELFTFNPELMAEDDAEANDIAYEPEQDGENQEEEVKAFEINDRMFFLGEDGKYLDDDLDDEPEKADDGSADQPGPSKPIVFDENLFDADDIPSDLDDEDDDEAGDEDSDEKAAEALSKLKV
ncbi:zinc finger protein [Aphelenchoides avenae]|nr:zinc finger protein [Aphelenchus avenae]